MSISEKAIEAAAWKEIAEERERTNEALHRELDDMTERCRTAEQRVRAALAAAPPAPVQEDNPIIEAARRWQRLMHDAGRERQLTASESGLLANLKAALVAEKDAQ